MSNVYQHPANLILLKLFNSNDGINDNIETLYLNFIKTLVI